MNHTGWLILGLVFMAGIQPASAQRDMSDFVGEKIIYSIKQVGLKAGEAVLSYEGTAFKEDQDYALIIFKADGFNFYDLEKIYADPVTLLPKIVERDLNIFGSKEQIVEYYDTEKGEVRIVKTAADKTTTQIIEKKGGLDNIYCFIYRYRREGDFKVGDSVAVSLPTMDLNIRVDKKTRLSAAGKKYDSLFLESTPSKYKIWFDAGIQKIPLRIDGAVGMGNTSMTMKSYETKKVFAKNETLLNDQPGHLSRVQKFESAIQNLSREDRDLLFVLMNTKLQSKYY